MTYEPITKLEIENYGCIRKASFALSPLHALIGPNDSGKSTALRALRTLAQFAAGDFGSEANTRPVPFAPMLDMATGCTSLAVRFGDGLGYRVLTTDPKRTEFSAGQPPTSAVEVRESVLSKDAEQPASGKPRAWNHLGILQLPSLEQPLIHLKQRLTTATIPLGPGMTPPGGPHWNELHISENSCCRAHRGPGLPLRGAAQPRLAPLHG